MSFLKDKVGVIIFWLLASMTAVQVSAQEAAYINPEEATAMAEAGADILIPHMGLTTKGSIGAETAVTLEDAAGRVQAMHDAAKKVNSEILVLCHGGPIAEPSDAQYILDNTEGIAGFYGASSMERLPVEPAITNRIREFTDLKM